MGSCKNSSTVCRGTKFRRQLRSRQDGAPRAASVQQTTHTFPSTPLCPSPQGLSDRLIVVVLCSTWDSWREGGGGSFVILATMICARDLLCNFPGEPTWQPPRPASITLGHLTIFREGSPGPAGYFAEAWRRRQYLCL